MRDKGEGMNGGGGLRVREEGRGRNVEVVRGIDRSELCRIKCDTYCSLLEKQDNYKFNFSVI